MNGSTETEVKEYPRLGFPFPQYAPVETAGVSLGVDAQTEIGFHTSRQQVKIWATDPADAELVDLIARLIDSGFKE